MKAAQVKMKKVELNAKQKQIKGETKSIHSQKLIQNKTVQM